MSNSDFKSRIIQSCHRPGGNERIAVGHGSPDLPAHPIEVRIQEAENVRGAVEQCSHAKGFAGG